MALWRGRPGALAALDVGLIEDRWKVWDATEGRVLARSPTVRWAIRTPLCKSASLLRAALARNLPMPRVIRVALRPNDLASPAVLASINSTVEVLRRSRTISRYADLVQDGVPVRCPA